MRGGRQNGHRKEGKRGWSGSAAPTREELLYESSLKEWVHACFLSPAENSPLLPSPFSHRSAWAVRENKGLLHWSLHRVHNVEVNIKCSQKSVLRASYSYQSEKFVNVTNFLVCHTSLLLNSQKATSTQETKGRSWDVWMHLHIIISPTRLKRSQIMKQFESLATAEQNLNSLWLSEEHRPSRVVLCRLM